MLTATIDISKTSMPIYKNHSGLWDITVQILEKELSPGSYNIDPEEKCVTLASYVGGAAIFFLSDDGFSIIYIEYKDGIKTEELFLASPNFKAQIRGFIRRRMNNVS